ncbi:uncharacterized protein PHALS_15046 [Plasmopara halstedii]|uniref:Uncharacterized protein n=1 Tax=Plasmopara halstedii TaxID=4781 RepID=A0A0P1B2N7_PLAHL|nr:uncharacterized protein PHALS_15046 [Plasmopara halstedii]CEG47608.1 hypothetical protein PHALS_15046 [Plasmopara halstedii]|eukprot:XP_024583977.1 hypothetical protein PHALS_15046 [Plasmopara halstedii]
MGRISILASRRPLDYVTPYDYRSNDVLTRLHGSSSREYGMTDASNSLSDGKRGRTDPLHLRYLVPLKYSTISAMLDASYHPVYCSHRRLYSQTLRNFAIFHKCQIRQFFTIRVVSAAFFTAKSTIYRASSRQLHKLQL